MERPIATYNMSFMSDMMMPLPNFASEAAFLMRTKDEGLNRRQFWENAKAHLGTFINSMNPLVVGLQEMNLTSDGATGSSSIANMISEINSSKGTNYAISCLEMVVNPNVKPALCLIWDVNVLGSEVKSAIVDNSMQGGRPLQMVYTSGGYLLLNTHGLQDPKLGRDFNGFNNFNGQQKNFIVSSVQNFVSNQVLGDQSINGIFLVGDFNDRFDQIKQLTFQERGKTFVLKQTGDAPRSCCYNYDSSCNKDMNPDKTPKYISFAEDNNFGYCTAVAKKETMPGDEGYVKNYVNAGDKVFSSFATSIMETYPSNPISTESDHELVYAMVNLQEPTMSGGRRRRGRRTRRKSRRGRRTRRRCIRTRRRRYYY
jgi:hypothetical protein